MGRGNNSHSNSGNEASVLRRERAERLQDSFAESETTAGDLFHEQYGQLLARIATHNGSSSGAPIFRSAVFSMIPTKRVYQCALNIGTSPEAPYSAILRLFTDESLSESTTSILYVGDDIYQAIQEINTRLKAEQYGFMQKANILKLGPMKCELVTIEILLDDLQRKIDAGLVAESD